MPNATDIIPAQAGEPISAALMNDIMGRADAGRWTSADGITDIGSSRIFAPGRPPLRAKDYLISVHKTGEDSTPPSLGGGLYYGALYYESFVRIAARTAGDINLELPNPVVNAVTCVVLNLAEDGNSGHSISADCKVVGHFIGWLPISPAGADPVLMPVFAIRMNEPYLFRIAAHTGSGALNWNPYTATMIGGASGFNLYNGFEDNGLSATAIQGSPGSLGVNVDSSGVVNSGSCHVQPIGNALVIAVWDGANSRWTFSAPNSAQ